MGKFRRRQGPAALAGAVVYAAADFDGNGRTDLAAVRQDGSVELLANQTETKNNWPAHESARREEHEAGLRRRTSKLRPAPRFQKQTYRGMPLHFGLGPYTSLETVRITWANGNGAERAQADRG